VKTLILAALIGLICLPASAQFFEDFNAGIPGDWGLEDYQDGGSAFMWGTNVDYGYDNWTGGDGMCVHGDSDDYGGEFDIGLVTPMIDLTGAMTFEADLNYANYVNYDFFDIDIDAGGGWVNLLRWNEDHGGFQALPGEHVMLDISGYAGQMAKFRFHYYDPNVDDWDWYAQIDNVAVTVPEPGLISLAGGLLGLAALAIRRR
jgi:hypothetical protein